MDFEIRVQGKGSEDESEPLKVQALEGRSTGDDTKLQDIQVLTTRGADVRRVPHDPEVYDPCDDSFALVDALLSDQAHLKRLAPGLCVEIGCGSGYVVASLALILGADSGAQFLATDLSPRAAEVAQQTLAAHAVTADVIVTDLVGGLEGRLAGSVDVLLFNPPYVPTPEEDVGCPGITASWAGGERGRTVINRALELVDSLLSWRGWFYLVTLTANDPGEICRDMRKLGFASRIVIQRYTEEESLHVLKFWREGGHDSPVASGSGSGSGSGSLSSHLARLAFWRTNSS